MDRSLENLLGALALVVSDRVRAAVTTHFDRGGETPAALGVIGAAGGISVGGLQTVLGLSQPGAVRLVDRLVADGLAERARGTDGRVVLVLLTARGRRMRRRVLDDRERAVSELTAVLDERERAALEPILDRLLQGAAPERADRHRACRMCDQRACTRCPIPGMD